jgi:hypothetical protein
MINRSVFAKGWLVLTVVLWPTILITQSIEWTLRTDWPTPALFEQLGTAAKIPDLPIQHQLIFGYFFDKNELTYSRLSIEEKNHLQDVKQLLQFNRMLGYLTFVVLLFTLTRPKLAAIACRSGIHLLWGLILGIGLIASRWILFTRGIHPVFFPAGNWDFNPAKHLMVAMYTQSYLAGYGIAILTTLCLASGLIYLLTRPYSRAVSRQRWERPRLQLSWMIATTIGLLLMYWFGQHMVMLWSWAWWIYLLLCVVVLATSIHLFLSNQKSSALLQLIASFLLYQSFAFGVRTTTVYANQVIQVQGKAIVSAIQQFHKNNNRFPDHLIRLTPQYIAEIKRPLPSSLWTYQVNQKNSLFILEFVGPLAFTYSYHSRTRTWNYLLPH